MNSTADASALQPDHDSLMFFAGGPDESLANADLFFGTSPMVTDLDDNDFFSASPRQSSMNPTTAKDDVTRTSYESQQTGSSPEESSEDSSSDDSARHKRKSSSMSFQTSNDGESFDPFKVWGDGNSLAPALSSDKSLRNNIRPTNQEMSNEDMEIHFDFKSAASSPRPSTFNNSRSSLAPSMHGVRPKIEGRAREVPRLVGTSRSAGHSPPASAPPRHIFTGAMSNASSPGATASTMGAGSRASHHPTSNQKSPSQSVVHPLAMSSHKYSLVIHPIPQKSRVETQIPIKMTLFPVPEGVKKLHLPTHTISKPKLIQRPPHEKSADTLELYSALVCTSAMQDPHKRARALARAAAKTREQEDAEKGMSSKPPSNDTEDPDNPLNGGEVNICGGCITRERKRAARKKSKKPDEEAAWANDEARRVVVFNTNEVRPWDEPEEDTDLPDLEMKAVKQPIPDGAKQIKMPMRIACYCRHHNEKLGFQVILTIKDHRDRLVAQAISHPIVITDDHKAQPPAVASPSTGLPLDGIPPWIGPDLSGVASSNAQFGSALQRNAFSSNDLQAFHQQMSQQQYTQPGFRPFASVQTTAINASAGPNRSNRSRQASPSSAGPISKKRKSSGTNRLPESLIMTTSLQVSPTQINSAPLGSATNGTYPAPTSAVVSPFTAHFPSQTLQQMPPSQQRSPPFPSGPPTPDSSTNDFFNHLHRSQSFDASTAAQPMFSQPPSTIPSRAPSPSSLAHAQGMQGAGTRATSNAAFSTAQGSLQQRSAVINKIIPTQGPITGGIEVTCLGSGFYQGVEVMFGDALATTTTYWGESTLVCLLPAADRAGQVPVTLKHQYEQLLSGGRHGVSTVFTYIDESEQDMLRQALVILGQKITGRVEDAGDIVRQVLPSTQGSGGWSGYGSGGGQHRQVLAQGFGIDADAGTEEAVLKCLELIDMDESPHRAQLDLPCYNGQTLLHLAASLGYRRLVAGLLARGANPNFSDRNGYSPLHMASLRGHTQVVRRMLFAGGDFSKRSHLGFRPVELATDPAVIQTLCLSRQTQRTLYPVPDISRTSRQLVTPPRSRSHSTTRYDAGDEWDDISSDEDDATQVASSPARSWRESRHSGSLILGAASGSRPSVNSDGRHVSPAVAMVAWRDQLAAQVQQFQQSFENMLPHLQMPNLPAMPQMPNLPNYQAPAMVRRLSSLVPQRSSRSEGESDENEGPKDLDHRWWDIFGGTQTLQSSPPAYDEIYPESSGNRLDRKAAAVATAISRNSDEKSDMQVGSLSAQDATPSSADDLAGDDADILNVANPNRKRLRSDRNLFFIWISCREYGGTKLNKRLLL